MAGRLSKCLEIVAIFGTAAGAMVSDPAEAGQKFPKERVSRAHIEWCYKRYKTYRLLDNTYVDANGQRRKCISPYS